MKTSLVSKAFTLIEILVVMVIISIIITFAMITIDMRGSNRQVSLVSEELLMVLKLAQQQAILNSTVYGLKFLDKGYQFYQYQESNFKDGSPTGEWIKLKKDPILGFRKIPKNINIKSQPTNKNQPKIIFYSSGEQSNFTITISSDGASNEEIISGSNNGLLSRSSRETGS